MVFFPSDPCDKVKTQAELRHYEEELENRRKQQKRDDVRFWISAVLSGIAAMAAVVGVILQLVSMR
jgi:hypothetical protein